MQRHRRIVDAALTVSFVLLAATVAFAQPGGGPLIRSASNLEGTVMTIVSYIAVIATVGAVISSCGNHTEGISSA